MDLIAKEEGTSDTPYCQGLGVWNCTYSVSAQVITVFCPEVKEGNTFSPAVNFSRY